MWIDYGDAFQDVKPPMNSMVVYFSDDKGEPKKPPQGEESVFVLFFTRLPDNILWTTCPDPSSGEEPKEINGLRIVFDNRGAIREISPELVNNAMKVVESSTAQDALEDQLLQYIVLVTGTGSVRIMNQKQFDTYLGLLETGEEWEGD